MTITAKGFDEPLQETWLTQASPGWGTAHQIVDGGSYAVNEVARRAARVRTCQIVAWGVHVDVTTDDDLYAEVPAASSGSRWDCLVLRVDWRTNRATRELVTGTSRRELPGGMQATPGVVADVPLLLLQVGVGQDRILDVVDLRVFASKTLTVADPLALPTPLRGGRAVVAGQRWWEAGGRWEVDPGPAWQDLRLLSVREWPGHGFRPQWRRDGQRVDLRGRVQRVGGDRFTVADRTGWGLGWLDGVVAYNVCAANGDAAYPKSITITAQRDGTAVRTGITAFFAEDSQWIDLGGGVLWAE